MALRGRRVMAWRARRGLHAPRNERGARQFVAPGAAPIVQRSCFRASRTQERTVGDRPADATAKSPRHGGGHVRNRPAPPATRASMCFLATKSDVPRAVHRWLALKTA